MAACVMPRGPTCRRAQRAFLCKYLKYLAELTKKISLGAFGVSVQSRCLGAITRVLGVTDIQGWTLWGSDFHLGLTHTNQVGDGICVSLSVQPPIRWVFLLVSAVRWWRCPILSLHCRGALACGATEPGCCPITCCLPAAGRWVLQDQHSFGLGSFPGSVFPSRQIVSHAFFSKIHQLRTSRAVVAGL